MGLAEKRKAESIKTQDLPKFESKLNEIAGYPIAVEINWDTFTAFDQYPLDRLVNFVFGDITNFVKKICVDDMGKEALKEKLTSIHISNTDQDDDYSMELKDNGLYLTEKLVGGSFGNHRTDVIFNYVEPLL